MENNLRHNSIQCAGHTRPVVDLKFSKLINGELYYLITASKDGIPMLRFGNTGDWIGSFIGHKGAVWSCSLSDCGKYAATGAADFTAKIWDAETGKNIRTISQNHIVRSVEFNNEADMLVTANNKLEIQVHDLRSNKEILKFTGHKDIIRRAVWLENNATIISVSQDKYLKIWDLRKNEEVLTKEFQDRINDINIVDKNMIIATDSTLYLYDLNNSEDPFTLVNTFQNESKIFTASLHPNIKDSNMFVFGTENSLVLKCDIESGKIIDNCKGHFGPVHCVRYSPDGHLFASGSEDGTIRLWQNFLGEKYGLWYLSKLDKC